MQEQQISLHEESLQRVQTHVEALKHSVGCNHPGSMHEVNSEVAKTVNADG
jgi:hypothetical protein